MSRVGAEGELQEQQAVRQTRPTNTPRRIAVIPVCALVLIAAAIVLLVIFIPGQANSNEGGELGLVCVASQVYEKLSDLHWCSGVGQFILQSTLSKRTLSKPRHLSKPDSKFGPLPAELHLYLCNWTLSKADTSLNRTVALVPRVSALERVDCIRKGNVDVTEESLGKLSFSSTYHVHCARNISMTRLSGLQGMAGTAALEAQLVSPYDEVGGYLPGCKIVWLVEAPWAKRHHWGKTVYIIKSMAWSASKEKLKCWAFIPFTSEFKKYILPTF